MTPEQRHEIQTILDRCDDMSIATVRPDGYPQATTVSFVNDGLTIYFGCDSASQKVANIQQCDKVSVTVNLPYEDWTQIRGLSIGGRARLVTEPDELERVYTILMEKFPQIEDYAGAEDRAQAGVVRVDAEVITLLDYRKAFGHTEQFHVRQH